MIIVKKNHLRLKKDEYRFIRHLCRCSKNYLGKRIKRGLFSSSTGILLNADINGALGILLKGKHKVDVNQLVSSGCLPQPSRIYLLEIKEKSAIQLIELKSLISQAPRLALG